MSPPDPHSDWLNRISRLPKPVLREDVRQRSLATALARLEESHGVPPGPERKYRRVVNIHTVGWAACWATIGFLQSGAPPRSLHSETPAYAAWPTPPVDPAMARLMASLYPQRPLSRQPTSFPDASDTSWILQP